MPRSRNATTNDHQIDEDENPSNQLQHELKQSILHALSTRRPVLTHLNADTTWLLSVTDPAGMPERGNRIYYHILIDPWLRGSQSDVAKFFSQQWHKEDSSVQTISEVEDVIQGIEHAAGGSDQEHISVKKETLMKVVCYAWVFINILPIMLTRTISLPNMLYLND